MRLIPLFQANAFTVKHPIRPYQPLFGNKQDREKQQLNALQASARDIIRKIEALETDLLSNWKLIEKKREEMKTAKGEYQKLSEQMKNLQQQKNGLDPKNQKFKELDQEFNQKLQNRNLAESRIKLLIGVVQKLEKEARQLSGQIEGGKNDKTLAEKVLKASSLAIAHASYRNISGRFLK